MTLSEDGSEIGGKIRRLRRSRRLGQSELATALGISSSYLNLIEHNRRKVTVRLLFSIAGYFGIEPGELVDGDEARLSGHLMEMFADEVFADQDVTNHEVRDLAHSNPAAARAVLALYDRYRGLAPHRAMAPESDEPPGFHLATEAISDFLQLNANHFPLLEEAAERIRTEIDLGGDDFDSGARTYLHNVFGIDVASASLPRGIVRQVGSHGERLLLSDLLPKETMRFLVAQHIATIGGGREIETLIASADLPDTDAPVLARNVLSAYLAAALIMPYAAFLEACRNYRYDLERLGHRFGASFEQICHRVTTLQRKGASGIPFHLVRTDIAGNISKRFSLSGIHIPRHSGACPRWNVYAAFLSPDRLNIQVSEMPDGARYFCVARTVAKGAYRYNAPVRYVSIGVGCSILRAGELVYSDGIDLDSDRNIVPIGVSCRICPRLECGHRAHPPANHRFEIDETSRPESIYARMR